MSGYADASQLAERSAAAFVSGIPAELADDGFVGSASIAWRIGGDLAGPSR